MRFEDLEVWKRSARLSAELYKALRELKDFAFRDQITRSALSISSNIAEGWERNSKREFSQYLKYALGSCGELRTQLYIGIEAEYLNREQGQVWIRETRELSAMLRSLQTSTIAEEPGSTYEA
ncbi:four helix bundle protein [Natronospira bacteriovora]|uniref:Four helix bundle protein n=1 Tax=Natronospira bacteriovora TaxID=3069753 RepID=A0ABU0W918_9GAMM|nr:four helix bundle protein [Natronospira sp. AB-CW4]MDQ2069480.1 four helix bundle protein [Natronospira sp. AB-CW4]